MRVFIWNHSTKAEETVLLHQLGAMVAQNPETGTDVDKLVNSTSQNHQISQKLMSSSSSNSKLTVKISRKVAKPFKLKYPSMNEPPEVDVADKEMLAFASTSSSLRMLTQIKPLVIKKINRHRSLNADVHKTFYYASAKGKGEALVLRRGFPLRLSLSLNRSIGDNDVIFLEFRLNDVDRPAFADGSFIRVKLDKGNITQPNNEFLWAAAYDMSDNGRILHLQVKLADKAPLGHWSMRILATSATGNYDMLTAFRHHIYIVANPWGKDFLAATDGVEMRRRDYVMADVGLVFTGFAESPVAMPWRFGQFDKNILESSVTLLRGLSPIYRSHLFKVVHHLSIMLNPAEDAMMEKDPNTLMASCRKILRKFTAKKKKTEGPRCNPALTCTFTTVCRALGIPARPVTFYNVIPENEGGLGVDRFYHYLGLPLHNLNPTNMWSCKVMAEVLVSRPDLPRPFSSTSWQCVSHFGPCSVATIRAGAVYRAKPYSTDFIYRLVKAQYVNLKVEDTVHPVKVVPARTMMMCSVILTKAVGSWAADNIVDSYMESKHPYRPPKIRDHAEAVDATAYEINIPLNYSGGTKKSHTMKCRFDTNESGVFDRVPRSSPTGVPLIDMLRENGDSISGFYFDEELDLWSDLVTSSKWWGEPIIAALVARSKLKSDVTALFSQEISKVTADGQLLSTLKTDQTRVILKPEVEEMMKIQLTFDDYSKHLKPGDTVRVNANIHVEEEDYDQYFEKFVGFLPLNVSIKVTSQTSNGCRVSLSNMSNNVMKKCDLSIRELNTSTSTKLFSGLKLEPATGVEASLEFSPVHPTGIYMVEVRAVCGDRFTSTYAALSFNSRCSLVPDLPSKAFPPI